MPSPERPGEKSDRVPLPYHRAVRFPTESSAAGAYARIEDLLLRRAAVDLSVYRLLLDMLPHVIVLGSPPPERIEQRLRRALAGGEEVPLALDVLAILWRRREEARGLGPWVERHHRPGKRL